MLGMPPARRPAASIVPPDATFLEEQMRLSAQRRERFAREAAAEELSPQQPAAPRRIAWPGGKVVTNRERAVELFIQRKRESEAGLSPAEEARIRASVARNEGRQATVRAVATATATQARVPSALVGAGASGAARRRRKRPWVRRQSIRWLMLATCTKASYRTSAFRAFFSRRR